MGGWPTGGLSPGGRTVIGLPVALQLLPSFTSATFLVASAQATTNQPRAFVCAGTRIGSGCVVGAQSFVKGDVPDRAVVGGSPARLLGMVRGDGADVEVWTGPDAIRAFHDLRERPEA